MESNKKINLYISIINDDEKPFLDKEIKAYDISATSKHNMTEIEIRRFDENDEILTEVISIPQTEIFSTSIFLLSDVPKYFIFLTKIKEVQK